MNEAGTRLLDNLPAIYRTSDPGGNLGRLLGVFEEMLFHAGGQEPPGIEEQIEAIPGLFSPGGDDVSGWLHLEKAPDQFLPWLATWVAFTPHALFPPHQLRAIISRIAPLYGRRGTRAYLEQLLEICFPEISKVVIDDEAALGLVIGRYALGMSKRIQNVPVGCPAFFYQWDYDNFIPEQFWTKDTAVKETRPETLPVFKKS